jgi:hypothetical protein
LESDLTRRGFLALVPGVAVAGALGAGDAQTDDICYLSLRELARLIHARKLSAREVMSAHLEQIRRWNPHLNAIVAKLDDAACLALADAADARMSRGEPTGALHGLPWAFKDLEPVTGFPWSRGLADLPQRSAYGRLGPGGAHPPSRRTDDRQDQHTGIWHGFAHL